MQIKLYQFSISHFSEKVRWALDYKKVKYEQELLIPLLHLPVCYMVSGQTKVPILKVGNEVWTESAEIIKKIDRAFPESPLFSDEPTENAKMNSLIKYFDNIIGTHVRIVAYDALFRYAKNLSDFFSCGLEGPAALTAKGMTPVLKMSIQNLYHINPEAAAASRKKLMEALDRIEVQLKGNEFLIGNSFSAADLTAASLLYPLIMPSEFSFALPSITSPDLQEFMDSFAEHEAIRYAKRMWSQYRRK